MSDSNDYVLFHTSAISFEKALESMTAKKELAFHYDGGRFKGVIEKVNSRLPLSDEVTLHIKKSPLN